MKGRLIVIEGTDASGKGTQARLLNEKLGNSMIISFPQYDSFFGKLVAGYLRGEYGTLDAVRPQMAALLYALDRFGAKEMLIEALDAGKTVILDRYIESNLAYQGAKDRSAVAWIRELEYERFGMPRPDVVIYLDVPLHVAGRLIEGRPKKGYLEGEQKDIHEMDRGYLAKVDDMYRELSKEPGWVRIECTRNGKMLSLEQVHELILRSI
ncbi:MAG: dTMP kinase [archaeon]